MELSPSPASLQHPPEKIGSGTCVTRNGVAVESISKVKLLFPIVLGWLWS